ncbi:putative membrane protein [Frankia sp. AiPs1]|uniref:DUF1003 domain-containing protein n=1 Tax=Frankia sp. AiPa1 TaxID=573492 RepID=UPI00202AD201|nr:DUF1003 domain-containing protein [Frankia sp. AiPa1]MCL9757735.1 DUF1003 domain-containing protein [Frankia sp. AiPa1]
MAITASRSADRHRSRADRLDLPATSRATRLPRVDRENASRVAETIARFLGTGRYLAIQTALVIVWIGLNIAVPLLRWDPYPFILLNLAFSTQAAYAAPLILLAQNRQDDRDRAALTEDRAVAGRMRDDTEFLTREVAGLRLAQSEAATRQYLRGELAGQLEAFRRDVEHLLLAHLPPAPVASRTTAPAASRVPADPAPAHADSADAMRAEPTPGDNLPADAPPADAFPADAPPPDAVPPGTPGPRATDDGIPLSEGTRTDDGETGDDAASATCPPPVEATRTGNPGAIPAARVPARASARTTTGRAHHRSASLSGATRRVAERPKTADSPPVDTRTRHV